MFDSFQSWGEKQSASKTTVPITKKMAMRMKLMRSMTAAATIQSFIMRSFSSFSRRTRATILTLVSSRSRIFTSRRSASLVTCPADSVSAADAAVVFWLLSPFNKWESVASCSCISSASAFFFSSPAFVKQEYFTRKNVARCPHTSFLNYSYHCTV